MPLGYVFTSLSIMMGQIGQSQMALILKALENEVPIFY